MGRISWHCAGYLSILSYKTICIDHDRKSDKVQKMGGGLNDMQIYYFIRRPDFNVFDFSKPSILDSRRNDRQLDFPCGGPVL